MYHVRLVILQFNSEVSASNSKPAARLIQKVFGEVHKHTEVKLHDFWIEMNLQVKLVYPLRGRCPFDDFAVLVAAASFSSRTLERPAVYFR